MAAELKKSEFNDKKIYALRHCPEIMLADEAYGRDKFGTLEEIAALTPGKIYAAWRRLLESAVVQIDIIGNVDFDAVEQLFSERFGKINRKPEEIKTEFIKSAGEPKKVREALGVKQGKLVIGMRAGTEYHNDNYPALSVMCDLFGGIPH